MSKNTGSGLVKTLVKMFVVGVAGGAALIAGANKAGQTFLNEDKKKKLPENK